MLAMRSPCQAFHVAKVLAGMIAQVQARDLKCLGLSQYRTHYHTTDIINSKKNMVISDLSDGELLDTLVQVRADQQKANVLEPRPPAGCQTDKPKY
jgi:hypothetical protein